MFTVKFVVVKMRKEKVDEERKDYAKLPIVTESQNDYKSDYSSIVVGGDVEATLKVKGGDVSKSQNDSKIYSSTIVVGGEVEATLKVKGGEESQNDYKSDYSSIVVGGDVEATLKVKGGDGNKYDLANNEPNQKLMENVIKSVIK